VFKIVKVHRINPVIYLLKGYHGKSITEAFYEYKLDRATHPDIYLVKKVLRRRINKVYEKWLGFDGSHNSHGYTRTMQFDLYKKFFIVKRIKNTYTQCIQHIT